MRVLLTILTFLLLSACSKAPDKVVKVNYGDSARYFYDLSTATQDKSDALHYFRMYKYYMEKASEQQWDSDPWTKKYNTGDE